MKNLKHTTLRVPAAHLEKLTELAENEGLLTADLMRRAIREYLEREGNLAHIS